jgi:MoxR-like ATPase
VDEVQRFADDLKGRWHRAVVGQEQLIDRMLVAVVTGGHVLLEGVPGTAKTLAVKALARCLDLEFGRIQLTPDLLPADLLGTSIWHPATGEFKVRRGPLFTTFLLADEINRAPARTQSALLEAMEERQITLEGKRHRLPDQFTVFATQNPLEHEGTYPLPEAQLDRFAMMLQVPYPSLEAERDLLVRVDRGFDPRDLDSLALAPGKDLLSVAQVQAAVAQVSVASDVLTYLLQFIRRTRDDPRILLGASPRAATVLLRCAKGQAALAGRRYVTPDDVVALAPDVLRHRLILHGEAELAGLRVDDVVIDLTRTSPVPR